MTWAVDPITATTEPTGVPLADEAEANHEP
jgi:hypothetical protein